MREQVRFKCAENGRDSLLSVREVTTCSYLLVFASARLCDLHEFALAGRQPQQIVCYLEQQQEQQQPEQQQQQQQQEQEQEQQEAHGAEGLPP